MEIGAAQEKTCLFESFFEKGEMWRGTGKTDGREVASQTG